MKARKQKWKRPTALKSSGSVNSCVSAKLVDDEAEDGVVSISAWDGGVLLTEREVHRLAVWLSKASAYLKEAQ